MSEILFSQACENNKRSILEVLRYYFSEVDRVLEIGSGSGQHAVYFAEKLTHLFWQTSDQRHYHASINCWIDDTQLKNVGRPKILNVVCTDDWQELQVGLEYGGVFSANTAHIMSWDAVVSTFAEVPALLQQEGYFLLYGPFNRDGEFTSESNRQFHISLQQSNSEMGIRDDHDLMVLAQKNGLTKVDDVAMPANNRILVFQRG